MPSIGSLAAFAATAIVLIVIPGPSVLFVIGRAIALGRRAAVASVLGNASGFVVQAVLVAVGLGTIVSRSQAVFTVLKLIGAGYLVLLGVQAIRSRKVFSGHGAIAVTPPPTSHRFRQGFLVGATNPKGFILFSAVLPQYVDRSLGHVPVQMLVFAFVAIALGLVSDSIWALLAGTARAWFAKSPARGEALSLTGGVLMIGVGVQLAITGRRH
jgi:threonine/homoserine/homoserine lactone efflux protein